MQVHGRLSTHRHPQLLVMLSCRIPPRRNVVHMRRLSYDESPRESSGVTELIVFERADVDWEDRYGVLTVTAGQFSPVPISVLLSAVDHFVCRSLNFLEIFAQVSLSLKISHGSLFYVLLFVY